MTSYFPTATLDDTAQRLRRLRRIAWTLDGALRLPGTKFRFGLNSLIGLPPGIGDGALVLISLYFVIEAVKMQVPGHVLARMLFNIAVELVLGAIPFLGDMFDVIWKANLRNVDVLERHFGLPPGHNSLL